jgi:7-cyano-7-deazaguanine synthase in queuosine biosynthesis
MPEHLFLCGLTDAQCKNYGEGQRLCMQGASKNVNLKVKNLRVRLGQIEPDALTDLLEIATYVFRADNSIPRESRSDGTAGAEWRRTFHMVIAVREPGRWSEPCIMGALTQTLHFLSDDTWHFEFVDNHAPLSLQDYLPGLRGNVADFKGGTSVVLFSGGLDSFAGAVHELQATNRHVVLASHRTTKFIGKRQRELVEELRKEFGSRVTHVRVDAGASGLPPTREHTQRTRSFLFLSVAAVAARIEEADRIRFYENGIMSANLPISSQVLGTHASRSTHPRSIRLFNEFLSSALDDAMTVDNPFSFDTKMEVVQRLMATPFARYIKNTLSCSTTRDMTIMHPHCGECKQCIERRLSTLGANAADADSDAAYRVEFFDSPRQAGKVRAMAVDSVRMALDMASISSLDFAKRFGGELAWLMSAYPQTEAEARAEQFHAMFQRHGKRVEEIFQDAVSQRRAAIVSRTLSPDCLLWLAIEPYHPAANAGARTQKSTDDTDPIENDEDAGEDRWAEGSKPSADEILLRTDDSLSLFEIDGLMAFTGRTAPRILRFLVQEHRKDRNAEREPAQFRCFRAKQLADEMGAPSDEAVRKRIDRLRDEVREGFAAHGVDPGEDALIESTTSGYRLNPRVRIVVK